MTFDDYEIVGQISCESIVCTEYRARPKTTINGRLYEHVMLKRLNKPRNIEDCHSQAEQLILISLPSNYSMVKIITHFIQDNDYYLVMEDLGDAKSLRQVVDERAHSSHPYDTEEYLPVLHAKEITYLSHQMISLLAMIHSQVPPIRHGDIRPENIFQFSDPTISTAQFKLGNFGNNVANSDLNRLVNRGSTVSDFSCMYPELFVKLGCNPFSDVTNILTTASDMFALGATLLNLSLGFDLRSIWTSETGKSRFEGSWSFDEDILGQLDDIQMELWTQQSGLSQLTMRTCLRCHPEDRPKASDMMLMPTYFEALQECHKDVHEENKALKDMIEALEMRLREATRSVPPPAPTAASSDESGDSVVPPLPEIS